VNSASRRYRLYMTLEASTQGAITSRASVNPGRMTAGSRLRTRAVGCGWVALRPRRTRSHRFR
jgi:hypothetical protein